jgi:hypothetical protein
VEKSAFATNLDLVQASVAAFLKPLGFRKKGRTHNRTTDGGLVHVINFQIGAYPVREHCEITGLREHAYGQFTVNLGVLLPCVFEAEWQKSTPSLAREFDCSIRERLGTLAFGSDEWLSITPDVPAAATELLELLDKFGLPFVEQFPTYGTVLAYYDLNRALPGILEGRDAFVAGIVAHHLGDIPRASKYFLEARSDDNEHFRNHVESIAKQLGVPLL